LRQLLHIQQIKQIIVLLDTNKSVTASSDDEDWRIQCRRDPFTSARVELRRKHFIILPKDKRNYKVCPVTATLLRRVSEI